MPLPGLPFPSFEHRSRLVRSALGAGIEDLARVPCTFKCTGPSGSMAPGNRWSGLAPVELGSSHDLRVTRATT